MIPVGYMAKHVAVKPEWLEAKEVEEILSVSGCVSNDFADWINFWKHNGYWFFDSPKLIRLLARNHRLDLSQTRWFYFEAYEKEFDEKSGGWRAFGPAESLTTNVSIPEVRQLMGYDIVTFSLGNCAEHSPLSCNHVAENMKVNRHCLFDHFEDAMSFITTKAYNGCEPGPFRIFAVYEIPALRPRKKATS